MLATLLERVTQCEICVEQFVTICSQFLFLVVIIHLSRRRQCRVSASVRFGFADDENGWGKGNDLNLFHVWFHFQCVSNLCFTVFRKMEAVCYVLPFLVFLHRKTLPIFVYDCEDSPQRPQVCLCRLCLDCQRLVWQATNCVSSSLCNSKHKFTAALFIHVLGNYVHYYYKAPNPSFQFMGVVLGECRLGLSSKQTPDTTH